VAIQTPLVVSSGQVQRLQASDATLNIGAYATGSFSLVDGLFVILSKRLILTTNQRVTLAGTARLRID